MSDNKLKIRIHIQQPNQPETSEVQEQEESAVQSYAEESNYLEKQPFDWHKIAVAAVGLLAFIALIGAAGNWLIGDNNERSDSVVDDGTARSSDLTDYAARFNTFGDVTESDDDRDSSAAPPDTAAAESVPAVQAIADKRDTSAPKAKPANVAETKIDREAFKPPIPGKKPTGTARMAPHEDAENKSEIESQTGLQGIAVEQPTSAEASNETSHETADHPGVIRAQLTLRIRHREPVDAVRTLRLDGGSKRIYFFTELRGFENQSVSVDWYSGDRRITQTRLKIGARQWRTNAEKLLRQRDAGTWRAVLRDQSGKVLAERRLVVEP